MKILVERIFTCPTYTIGKMYINGVYLCDTIEDTDRNLDDSMTKEEILKIKKQDETAIPCGIYNLTMDVKSPKYSNFKKYKWAEKYDGFLPRLVNVKGFDGILIHVGNYASNTSGCILTGYNKVKGQVINSTLAFNKLMDDFLVPAKNNKEQITIEVKRKYKL
jgi:hypothetical protein